MQKIQYIYIQYINNQIREGINNPSTIVHLIKNILYLKRYGYLFSILIVNNTYVITYSDC